ncbi:MmcQ/YjbR family DNA-binding protein [Sorangium sp. KYC3313]|uniref:MmcQ/YjbR family DNA-binding protein n=1 Tax=Sorangium sp. KYC3313 TaxID=3449740 RepID=UPI003F8CA492
MTTRRDDARFTPILARLRDAALAYPGAVEEFPWGDRVAKVRGKIFVFLNTHEGKLHVTAKLPQSGEAALMLPFAEPTGYNLGKSGWVTARFGPKDRVPEAMMLEWIEESYRAVAPKRALQSLDGAALVPEGPGKPMKTSAPAARAAASQREAQATAAAAGKAAAKKRIPAKKAAAKKRTPVKKVAAAKETPQKKAAAKKRTPAKKAAEKESRRSPSRL